MQIAELTAADLNDLNSTGTVALRKLARELDLKGLSSARGEAIRAAIQEAWTAAQPVKMKKVPLHTATPGSYALVPETNPTVKRDRTGRPVSPKSGSCNVCEKRRAMKGTNGQCEPCFEEGGWENTHNDAGHADFDLAKLTEKQAEEVFGCWICYPELNKAKRPVREGRSRAGMVIVATGTEVHKSEIFKTAAEAAGWKVEITSGGEDYYATAIKAGNGIQLAWNGRAYNYQNSSATFGGKSRKVRNLKEAMRLLVG
jgi:hypothetical protein